MPCAAAHRTSEIQVNCAEPGALTPRLIVLAIVCDKITHATNVFTDERGQQEKPASVWILDGARDAAEPAAVKKRQAKRRQCVADLDFGQVLGR